jgi:hypothetical protein
MDADVALRGISDQQIDGWEGINTSISCRKGANGRNKGGRKGEGSMCAQWVDQNTLGPRISHSDLHTVTCRLTAK